MRRTSNSFQNNNVITEVGDQINLIWHMQFSKSRPHCSPEYSNILRWIVANFEAVLYASSVILYAFLLLFLSLIAF